MAVCGTFLKQGPSVQGKNANNQCDDDSGHALTIVGSQTDPITKACMLKVKNSWGGNCQDYHSTVSAGCEDGLALISVDTFAKYTMGVTYLDSP